MSNAERRHVRQALTVVEPAKLPDDLDALVADINKACADAEHAVRSGVANAIRAGELLIKAQARVPHGQWLLWLKRHIRFSERTAQLYMQLAALDEANRQRVADLNVPLRAALKMLRHERQDIDDDTDTADTLADAFVADTVEKTGMSPHDVQRDVARYEAVVVLPENIGTSLEQDAEIDALAARPEAEQHELAATAMGVETVSAVKLAKEARDAKAARRSKIGERRHRKLTAGQQGNAAKITVAEAMATASSVDVRYAYRNFLVEKFERAELPSKILQLAEDLGLVLSDLVIKREADGDPLLACVQGIEDIITSMLFTLPSGTHAELFEALSKLLGDLKEQASRSFGRAVTTTTTQ